MTLIIVYVMYVCLFFIWKWQFLKEWFEILNVLGKMKRDFLRRQLKVSK